MEIKKIKKIDSIGRTITKTIIITDCDYCSNKFEYTGGLSNFKKKSKNHFCGMECQRDFYRIHGMTGTYEYNIWVNIKRRAKKKGLDFTIEPKDIIIPKYCPILNIELVKNDMAGPTDNSPSLDRIDNTKGYIKNNIRIISNRANRIKADSNFNEIEKIYKDYLILKEYGKI